MQVELDEDSIPLTTFTAGPLGFYKCVRMPFGLTKNPDDHITRLEGVFEKLAKAKIMKNAVHVMDIYHVMENSWRMNKPKNHISLCGQIK